MPSLSPLCKPLALALLLLAPADVFAQPDRSLTVVGEGTAAGTPDRARVQTGVVSEGRTAAAALSANNAAMTQVLGALRSAGIPAARIQTSGLSVQPVFADGDARTARRIAGYRVSNVVSVRVDDLSTLGTLLDALVQTGANELSGIEFSIADPKPLLEAARNAAVADALLRARTLAAAAGVRLGPILSMQEGDVQAPVPMLRSAQAMDFGAAVPVAAGEQVVRAAVTMVLRIED